MIPRGAVLATITGLFMRSFFPEGHAMSLEESGPSFRSDHVGTSPDVSQVRERVRLGDADGPQDVRRNPGRQHAGVLPQVLHGLAIL